jgi:RNA polymerase sigma-70 factor (ECF subfamily)
VNDPADRALMVEIRGGNLDRLGSLYVRHREKVYGLCVRMTGDRDEAADLVHETFLRVLRYRGSFRGDARFTTWLYRIARNVCLDHLRTSKRSDELNAQIGASNPEPETEKLRLLRRALHALPAGDRLVIVLARYHGLRHRELSEILDCTEGAARVRLHRAIEALRESYRSFEEADHGL